MAAELDVPVEPLDAKELVAEGADMLLCSTDTKGKIAVERSFLGEARYLSSVGSTLPSQRELAAGTVGAAEVVVVDSAQALAESGDLIAAAAAGLLTGSIVPLASFLETGPLPGSKPSLTLYKSVGSFEQDLALAAFALRACERQGLGEEIAEIESMRPLR
jgi:ornithine cyclodeaminase/alanine dehydrogenase-like protein (mu-crystallin family)